jgi:hypothetical protein
LLRTNGSPEEKRTSAELIYGIKTWNRGCGVDARSDHTDHERIVDTSVLKELKRNDELALFEKW